MLITFHFFKFQFRIQPFPNYAGLNEGRVEISSQFKVLLKVDSFNVCSSSIANIALCYI